MKYITLDNTGTQNGSGNTDSSGGGSGLTWFQSIGTFWTTNSTTARFPLAVVIRQMYTATFDQLSNAFQVPYAGTLRQLNVVQNGPTSSAGNIILTRSTDGGATFNDWITLNGFVAAVNAYNGNKKTWVQGDSTAAVNAGDIIIPYIQYTATGVNQSTTCTMTFACPNVT